MAWRETGSPARFGWRGLGRAITATAVATSAFWIAIGVWLMPKEPDSRAQPDAVIGSAAARADARETPPPAGPVLPPRAASGAPLPVPVIGVAPDQLADTFAHARAAGARRHDAIDIMAPLGTPVVAAAPGRVEKLFVSKAGGNTIYIRGADGKRQYYYAHLDRYDPALREGQQVVTGTALGTVGYTGNASPDGPHLHFAIVDLAPGETWAGKGVPVNPYPLLTGKPATAAAAPAPTGAPAAVAR